MMSNTIMAYSLWDRNDVKGSGYIKWTTNTVENIEPTGRWRFKNKDGAPNKHKMEIEVTYTQCTGGTVYKERVVPFLKFFTKREEYGAKETMKDHGRTAWVNESDIVFSTMNTYECTNMGKE